MFVKIKPIIYAFMLALGFSFLFPLADNVEAKVIWGKIELKQGMIGKVTILKDTDLYRIIGNKLHVVRKAKKGQEFGVYSYKKDFGGLYGLGGGIYVKKSSSIKYETPSKAKLAQVKKEQELQDGLQKHSGEEFKSQIKSIINPTVKIDGKSSEIAPEEVTVVYNSGEMGKAKVTWDYNHLQTIDKGVYEVKGKVSGTNKLAVLKILVDELYITDTIKTYINNLTAPIISENTKNGEEVRNAKLFEFLVQQFVHHPEDLINRENLIRAHLINSAKNTAFKQITKAFLDKYFDRKNPQEREISNCLSELITARAFGEITDLHVSTNKCLNNIFSYIEKSIGMDLESFDPSYLDTIAFNENKTPKFKDIVSKFKSYRDYKPPKAKKPEENGNYDLTGLWKVGEKHWWGDDVRLILDLTQYGNDIKGTGTMYYGDNREEYDLPNVWGSVDDNGKVTLMVFLSLKYWQMFAERIGLDKDYVDDLLNAYDLITFKINNEKKQYKATVKFPLIVSNGSTLKKWIAPDADDPEYSGYPREDKVVDIWRD
ncbi:Ig-like domain-containing protein [Geobacillus proteiniphilus]|uniref:Ig-like domain-containing protein n=1 Tax=Geobacillus proteiniphilus TaxID=860353 RepID=A0ABY9MFT9_9BACL|nr:Ig-like domain-containing protein [Geobacillus proteiniphilus]WMJ16493.1 Ig-like domain-containing protein [Geobacillus proteiniphilus]